MLRSPTPATRALSGALDDPVVDVGEVLHHPHPVAALGEVPADHVEDQGAPGVAHVGEVVDGHPAHVQAHRAGAKRSEPLSARRVLKSWRPVRASQKPAPRA